MSLLSIVTGWAGYFEQLFKSDPLQVEQWDRTPWHGGGHLRTGGAAASAGQAASAQTNDAGKAQSDNFFKAVSSRVLKRKGGVLQIIYFFSGGLFEGSEE